MKKLRLIGLLGLLALLVVAAWQLPLESLMARLQEWASGNPTLALPAVVTLVSIAILLMLPSSLFMMLSGFLFGVVQGFVVVWLATLLASTAAFLLARSWIRPLVHRRFASKPTFMAIDRAIRRKGFFVVLLTRLIVFLPFPALNYSHGLTDVRLRDYVMGTMIGMVPPICLFVYLGSLASDVADIIHGRVALNEQQIMLAGIVGGLALAFAVGIGLAARRALRAELARATEEN